MSSGNGVFAKIVPTAAPSISAAAARFELLLFMAQRGELPEESLTPSVPRRADRVLDRDGRLIHQPDGRLLRRLFCTRCAMARVRHVDRSQSASGEQASA